MDKTYHIISNKFEFFVVDWEFFKYLINNPDASTSILYEVEILGVQAKALKDLSIFDKITLQEDYNYINHEGKKTLTPFAYLNYCRSILKRIKPNYT